MLPSASTAPTIAPSVVPRVTAPPVSAMIFTLNEELHLPTCLASLAWCDDVIVVDSFSTDRTEAVCREAGARFFQHAFTGFGDQRNWAMEHTSPRHEWVLVLDADERVTPELADEMRVVLAGPLDGVGAFRVRRRFHMWGRWLRHSSLYPNWVVRLVHRERVRYVNRGHAETQQVAGETRELHHDLIDENLKGIDEWFERQNRYAAKEAEHELAGEARVGGALGDVLSRDPLVRRSGVKRLAGRMPFRALAYFLYSYVWRRGFLDGRDGLMFCVMKALYQEMIVVKKYSRRRERAAPPRP